MCLEIKEAYHKIEHHENLQVVYEPKKWKRLYNKIFHIVKYEDLGYDDIYARKAEKDIITYKYLLIKEDSYITKTYYAPYREFQYILKNAYHIDNWRTVRQCHSVDEGFHSLRFDWRNIMGNDDRMYGQFKCIIPKGSYYYIGINDDIVSDTLIVDELIKTYKRRGNYTKKDYKVVSTNKVHSNKKKRKRKAKMRRR